MKKLLTLLSFIIITTVAMAADKYISSSGDIVLKTATSKKVNLNDTLYTTQAGLVGVGTSTPAVSLHVGGTGNKYIRVESSTNSNFAQMFSVSGSTGTEFKSVYRLVDTDNGNRLYIDSSGNTCVGCADPSNKLEVRDGVFEVQHSGGTDRFFDFKQFSGWNMRLVGRSTSTYVGIDSVEGTGGTLGRPLVLNGSGGQVGVGVTPAAPLDVNGAIKSRADGSGYSMNIYDTTGATWRAALYSGPSSLSIAGMSGVGLNLTTNNSANGLFLKASDGWVGIGNNMSNPNSPLNVVVNVAANWTSEITNNSTSAYGMQVYIAGETNMIFNARSGSSNKFTITGNGVYNQTNTGHTLGITSGGVVYDVSASSRKLKSNIDYDGIDGDVVYKLKPVTFTMKNDDSNTVQAGFIAEDVDEASKVLALYTDGVPDGVAYEKVSVYVVAAMKKMKKENDVMKAWICSQSNPPKEICQ